MLVYSIVLRGSQPTVIIIGRSQADGKGRCENARSGATTQRVSPSQRIMLTLLSICGLFFQMGVPDAVCLQPLLVQQGEQGTPILRLQLVEVEQRFGKVGRGH